MFDQVSIETHKMLCDRRTFSSTHAEIKRTNVGCVTLEWHYCSECDRSIYQEV